MGKKKNFYIFNIALVNGEIKYPDKEENKQFYDDLMMRIYEYSKKELIKIVRSNKVYFFQRWFHSEELGYLYGDFMTANETKLMNSGYDPQTEEEMPINLDGAPLIGQLSFSSAFLPDRHQFITCYSNPDIIIKVFNQAIENLKKKNIINSEYQFNIDFIQDGDKVEKILRTEGLDEVTLIISRNNDFGDDIDNEMVSYSEDMKKMHAKSSKETIKAADKTGVKILESKHMQAKVSYIQEGHGYIEAKKKGQESLSSKNHPKAFPISYDKNNPFAWVMILLAKITKKE